MRITDVKTALVSIPLEQPSAFGTNVITAREFVVVWIYTDEDVTGVGFTVGNRFEGTSGAVMDAVKEQLAPAVIAESPHAVERLWQRMFETTLLMGRRGAVMRAISAVDIALWDIMAKAAGKPLYELLGGYTDSVRVYASGGYYRDDDDVGFEGLAREMTRYRELGYDAVKMKVGRADVKTDAERVRVARETLGPDVDLAVDANNAWRTDFASIKAIRLMEPHDLWYVEEPVFPDNVPGLAKVARATDIPIATGELEATRWAFRDLLIADAAGIWQPDATVLGGVTEFMKVAHLAAAWDIPIAPHWMANVHIHLLAAIPNGLVLEYHLPDEDVFNFEAMVEEPLEVRNGRAQVPERHGHGIELKAEVLAKSTIRSWRYSDAS